MMNEVGGFAITEQTTGWLNFVTAAISRLKISYNGTSLFGAVTETVGGGTIQLPVGTTAGSGILFGTDTNLYRSAANTLTTDDKLTFTAPNEVILMAPTVATNGAMLTIANSDGQTYIGKDNSTGTIKCGITTLHSSGMHRIGQLF